VKYFICTDCGWAYVVGKKRVYGPIFEAGIEDYPALLSQVQHMMKRDEFENGYPDCAARFTRALAAKVKQP
jgi:hypothetical protein